MKRMLFILSPFILIAGAWFFYQDVLGGKYRVSDEHPLGQLEIIENLLLENGFEKAPFKKRYDPFTKLIGAKHGYTVTKYLESATKGRNMLDEQIWVAVDSLGVIRAIKGDFLKAPQTAAQAQITATRIFMLDFWETHGGATEPSFSEKPGTRSNWGYVSWAKFSGDRTEGLWEQEWELHQFIMIKAKGI